MAAVTAIAFALLAWRAHRNWILWAVGGALLALGVTTIVFGLGDAAIIPLSSQDNQMIHLKELGVTILILLTFGILFALGLRRNSRARPAGTTGDKPYLSEKVVRDYLSTIKDKPIDRSTAPTTPSVPPKRA